MVPLLDRSDLNKPPEYTIWFQEVVSNNFFFSNRRRRCRRWPAVASRARPINRAARRLFWAFATTAAATGWSTARRGSTGPDRTATATTSRPTTTKTTTEKTRLANFSYFSHIRSPHPHDKRDQAFLGHDLVWIAKNHSCSASSIQSCRFRGREAFFFLGGGGGVYSQKAGWFKPGKSRCHPKKATTMDAKSDLLCEKIESHWASQRVWPRTFMYIQNIRNNMRVRSEQNWCIVRSWWVVCFLAEKFGWPWRLTFTSNETAK